MVGKNILIVDDSADFCELISSYVSEIGLNPFATTSAAAALDLIEKYRFAASVIDVLMPEIMGVSLIKKMQQRGYSAPAIICSGFAPQEIVNRQLSLNIAAVLKKPVDENLFKAELLKIVRSAAIDNKSVS